MSEHRAEQTGPLYVDLDGTLISSDVLWESLFLLLRTRPADALRLPLWLLRGKAAFKRRIAERVAIDPRSLPYRPEVLAFLKEARAAGRRIVLTTASDRRLAAPIADHLGLFDAVLASDGEVNLSEGHKLRAIEAHGEGVAFEYVGNSRADVAVWRGARRAILVAPSRAAARGAARLDVPVHRLDVPGWRWHDVARALRPYQWVKNTLLFVPLVLAHQLGDVPRVLAVALAFAAFCACASATYLLNDLLDMEADRQHPRKQKRPFAAGTLPIPLGVGLVGALLVLGFGLSVLLLPPLFTGMLALYVLLTTAYSFYFKEILFLDILLLAGLYTHRVLSGAVAAAVPVSPWLLAFSMFFFISLAFVKRYAELLAARSRAQQSLARRGYEVGDLDLVQTMGLSSGYLSVLVIGLYVSSDAVQRLYPTPELLWLVCPVLLYWITRVWFLARRGVLDDDPVLFATRDRVSYVAGGLIGLLGALAHW